MKPRNVDLEAFKSLVEAHRDRLPAVKRGELPWTEVDAWR